MAKRKTPEKFTRLKSLIEGENIAKVGFFAQSVYPSGDPVAYIAAIQEFGSPEKRIPPRSFIRSTIKEKKAEWIEKIIQPGFEAILKGKMGIEQVADSIGLAAQADMKEKINTIADPPLKRRTILARMRRGKSSMKPLIDTGVMIEQLTYVVEKE